MDSVIDAELAAFLAQRVMLVAALRGMDGKAVIARGMGVRLSADRAAIDFLISRAQWPKVIQALEAGMAVALTACDPTNYRTFQIKGRVLSFADADAADTVLGENYRTQTFTHLKSLGVEERQIGCWLDAQDLVRLRIIPLSVFHQTPGVGAGAARVAAEGLAS